MVVNDGAELGDAMIMGEAEGLHATNNHEPLDVGLGAEGEAPLGAGGVDDRTGLPVAADRARRHSVRAATSR